MRQSPIRVLLIEDDSDDVIMLRRLLYESGDAFDVQRADRLAEGIRRFKEEGADVVLLDLGLPDSRGLDTLSAVLGAAGDVPIVVLTGSGDTVAGVRAARAGAQDYLVKSQIEPGLLAHTLRYAVVRAAARRREALQRKVLAALNSQPLLDMDALAGTLRMVTGALGIPRAGLRLRLGEHWPLHVKLREQTEHICTVGPDGEARRDTQGRLLFDCLCGDILNGVAIGGEGWATERGNFWTSAMSSTVEALGRTSEPGAARVCCTCGGCESVALIALRSEQEVIGLLQFADPQPGAMSAETVQQLEDIADSVGTALTRQRAEDALRKSAARVEAMRRVDEAVLAAQSLEEIAQAALSRLPDLIACTRASVVTFDMRAQSARALALYDAGGGASTADFTMPLAAFGDLDDLRGGEARAVADLRAAPPGTMPSALAGRARSSLSVPLTADDGLIGCLSIGWAEPGGIEEEDREIARELAGMLAVAIGSALSRERRQAAERALDAMNYQMRVAREIQQALYPAEAPQVRGFELAGESIPAEAAGGDYFDYVPMPGGYLGIAVGDVAGHGVGAAMVMAAMRAYLRGFASTSADVSEVLGLLNRALVADTAQNIFCTMLLARLDPRTGELVYVNAGHPPLCLFDASGNVRARLESTAMPLGLMPDVEFGAGSPATLAPGELAFFYTDGVLDVASGAGSHFGKEHVMAVVRANRTEPAARIVREVCRAVLRFCEPELPADDITALVVKALPRDVEK
jgi:serine phosphatase RsbU (regulator of sigma subunit)/CheY-like chemotaxis protein